MKKWLYPVTLMAVLGLTACASTPSKPLSFDQLGQFSSTPLNTTIFRINFSAPARMSYATAEEVTLIRAAQMTLTKGFSHFKVLDDPSNRSQQSPRQAVVYPSYPYPAYGMYRRPPAFWPDPFFDQPQIIQLEPTDVAYTIECYNQNAPSEAFDARLIINSLGPKYGLNPTGALQPQGK